MASSGRPPPFTPPSPIKEGKDLWHITRKLEGRGSEGKEALDSLHDNALVYMQSCFNTAKRRLAKDHSPCKDSLRPGISAPQNTPNPSAASGNSSSTKKQRRSVVEAGKAAHVKQKVALFENLKGQHVGSNSSSSTSSITTIATTTTTSTTSNSSSSSSSSSSYHAVFPGLNLGDASTMTMARNFIITIPRISEEAEDEMVALGEFSHEEGEEGDEVGEGKRTNQGVGTTTTARVLDMNDDEQFLPPSYGQWEGRQQKGKAGAAVEAAAAAAPSAAGLVTSTQQITLALKDLRLNGPSSDALQQQELQQDQPNGFKADVRVGGEENNQAAAGPAPIIECNRKLAIPCSHPQQQQQDIADSSCGSSSGPVGVLLGVFQKTLGLGKHHQRGSVPPVSPSSSLVGTAAAAAVSMAAPTMTTDALDSLPPIDAEDTYLMSESDEEGRSGGGGGGGKGFSDSEEEEEEELNRKRRATKKIPEWARGAALAAALEKQFTTDPELWVDPDTIFPEVTSTCNLEEIFKVRKKRYYKRTSSGMWENDGLTLGEKMTYRRAMKEESDAGSSSRGKYYLGCGGGKMGIN